MMKYKWVVIITFSILLINIVSCSKKPSNLDIILISIDSLRSDRWGCYGYPDLTSPFIDQLTKKGTTYIEAVSTASWTIPAHFSMLTGLYCMQHDVMDFNTALSKEIEYLPEVLKEKDYETFGIYSGLILDPSFGFSRGFDKYIDCYTTDEKDKNADSASTGNSPVNEVGRLQKDVTGLRILQTFTHWFKKRTKEKPYFAFLHFWDVHFDYNPPSPYSKLFNPVINDNLTKEEFQKDESLYPTFFHGLKNPEVLIRYDDPKLQVNFENRGRLMALYDGEIRWTDFIIGKILRLLEESGNLENTMIIVTSDHGEAFYEHGFPGHGNNLFEEEVRIPLIICYPKLFPIQICSKQASLIDIVPTILDILNIKFKAKLPGTSLLKMIEPNYSRTNPLLLEIARVKNEMKAVRTPEWKLVFNTNNSEQKFFDLITDPEEKHSYMIGDNLSELPEWIKGKRANGLEYYQSIKDTLLYFESKRSKEQPKLDDSTVEYLKSLGYIQ